MIFHSKSSIAFLLFLSAAIISLSGCDKHEHSQSQELITTLKLTFAQPGQTAKTFVFKDLDGVGGTAPTIDAVALAPNSTYTLAVEVLNESASPVEDITEEVQAEKDDHLFVYKVAGGANLTVTATDTDSKGKPVGLAATVTTGAASSGTLTVSLKHQPDKSAADPSQTGETDVEATFNVQIK